MGDLPVAKKSLGQHWLRDPISLIAMADAVEVSSSDSVLEIGPGPGTLTAVLTQRAKQVVAVEFDQDLAEALSRAVPAVNLRVVHQDILRFDLTSLSSDYKLVANIPYYLTSNLIRTISETPNSPIQAALLIQKEVAQRVAASPGGMSLLSVTAQYYWEVSLGMVMPARLFTPAPKVDSQILILKRRQEPLFPNIDTKRYFQLVKAGFSNRRKTILNSLSAGLQISKEVTRELLQAADISPTARPQELSLQQWHTIYSRLP